MLIINVFQIFVFIIISILKIAILCRLLGLGMLPVGGLVCLILPGF